MKAKIKTGKSSHFTEGVEYDIKLMPTKYKEFGKLFSTTNDNGELAICLEKECSHLEGGSWEIIE